jgi:hypothetical protein
VLACLGDKELSGSVTNTRLAIRKHRGGKQGQEYPFRLRLVEAPEKDDDGDPITSMVVDWLPPRAATATQAPDDPWINGCRQEDQKAAMSRFKRVLLAELADQGSDRPIPSATDVRKSDPPIEGELRTPVGDTPGTSATDVRKSSPPIGDELRMGVADAPVVRMVEQTIVWDAFRLCSPNDPRQTVHSQFTRARDRADRLGLIGIGNIDGTTYLWLTRPDPEKDDE